MLGKHHLFPLQVGMAPVSSGGYARTQGQANQMFKHLEGAAAPFPEPFRSAWLRKAGSSGPYGESSAAVRGVKNKESKIFHLYSFTEGHKVPD